MTLYGHWKLATLIKFGIFKEIHWLFFRTHLRQVRVAPARLASFTPGMDNLFLLIWHKSVIASYYRLTGLVTFAIFYSSARQCFFLLICSLLINDKKVEKIVFQSVVSFQLSIKSFLFKFWFSFFSIFVYIWSFCRWRQHQNITKMDQCFDRATWCRLRLHGGRFCN